MPESSDTKYTRTIKYWLLFILVFLPFQHTIFKITRLWSDSRIVDRLDEITIFIFTLFSLRELYKNKVTFRHQYCVLIFSLFVLIVAGLISGIVNGNALLTTLHGIFEYVKYLLVIFIYATFFKDFKEFRRIFKILIAVTVLLGAIAFLQEAWAMVNRYVLHKDINTEIIYLDVSSIIYPEKAKQDSFYFWRLGILRVSSLMINSNFLGLYILLILSIYTQIDKKINPAFFISFFSGILGSVSRIVYTCYILIGGIQVLRGRKWWIGSLIPITILLFYLSPLPEYVFQESQSNMVVKNNYINITGKKGWDYTRTYSREKAVEIWKDHFFFGAGPGMYGGAISFKYKSPLYDKYNFKLDTRGSVENMRTIDQFWPQMLAEIGVVGVACYILFIIFLTLKLYQQKINARSDEVKGLYTGLLIYMIILLISTLGYSFVPPIAYTFFAFVGISLGFNPGKDTNEA